MRLGLGLGLEDTRLASTLAPLQGYITTDKGAVPFAAVAALRLRHPPPCGPSGWLLGAVQFAAAPPRWPGYGLLGIVPFTAFATPRAAPVLPLAG